MKEKWIHFQFYKKKKSITYLRGIKHILLSQFYKYRINFFLPKRTVKDERNQESWTKFWKWKHKDKH